MKNLILKEVFLFLLLGFFAQTVFSQVTIKVKDTEGWGEMNLFAWGPSEFLDGWPGKAMTAEGDDWYSYEIPSGYLPANLIINGGGNQADIYFTAANCYLNTISSGTDATLTSCPGDPVVSGVVLKVKDAEGWGEMNLFAWGPSEFLDGWPGKAMTAEDDGWYSYEIPGGYLPANLIINGGGNQADIYFTAANCYLNTISSGTDATLTACPGPPPEGITIRVQDAQAWGALSVYAYGSSEIFGGWPGQAMIPEDNSWYSCTIPLSASVTIIINDRGSKKTVDMPVTVSTCYTIESTTWNNEGIANDLTEISCPVVGINSHQFKNSVIYPNPASDAIVIQSENPVKGVSIRNINGALVLKADAADNSINVSKLYPGTYFVELQFANGNVLYQKLIKN